MHAWPLHPWKNNRDGGAVVPRSAPQSQAASNCWRGKNACRGVLGRMPGDDGRLSRLRVWVEAIVCDTAKL
jgi:hypothetical protein